MSINFEYWNKPRNTGATTDMMWEAAKQAFMNPEKNIYVLFYGYQMAAEYASGFPVTLPNLQFTSVNMHPIGRTGMVYVDSSVKELNGDTLLEWERVAA